jgi:hypothetical protein
MHLPEYGAKDGKAAKYRWRHDGVSAYSHIEGSFGCRQVSVTFLQMSGGDRKHSSVLTVTGFVEAMAGIAMRREDSDLVASVLQPNRGINHQALSSTYAQVRMEEDNVLFFVPHDDFLSEGNPLRVGIYVVI